MQPAIRIQRVSLYVAPSYTNQYYRPYTSDIGNTSVIEELVGASGGRAEGALPGAISAAASKIIRPAAQTHGAAPIANGWETERLLFTIEAVCDSSNGLTQTVQYISGYTDYPGISMSGVCDPQMQLFFNSVLTFRVQHRQVAGAGYMPALCLQHAVNILTPMNDVNMINADAPARMLRPVDLVNSLQTTDYLNLAGNSGFPIDNVVDLTTSGGFNVNFSRLSNNNATEYMSRVLRAMASVSSMMDSYAVSDSERLANLSGALNEPLAVEFNIIRELVQQMGYGQETNSVTWGNMEQLFPGIDKVTNFFSSGGLQAMPGMIDARNAESSGSSTQEALAANIVAQALPSIMTQCMLSEVSFTMTNEVVGSPFPYVVKPGANIQTFAKEADFRALGNAFLTRVEHEICPAVSLGNTVSFDIAVNMCLNRDSTIFVRLNGGHEVPFVIPTFASSIAPPVTRATQHDVQHMANDIDYLFDQLQPRGNHGHGAHPMVDPFEMTDMSGGTYVPDIMAVPTGPAVQSSDGNTAVKLPPHLR